MSEKTYTLKEALESGKEFRRAKHERWAKEVDRREWLSSSMIRICFNGNRDTRALTPEDVFANDWEIREPEVSVTREKLEAAVKRLEDAKWHIGDRALDLLAKELGL